MPRSDAPSLYSGPLPALLQLGKTLPSVARLAHQLDCPRLLSKLDAYLSGTGKWGRSACLTALEAAGVACVLGQHLSASVLRHDARPAVQPGSAS